MCARFSSASLDRLFYERGFTHHVQLTPLFNWQEGNKWTNYMNIKKQKTKKVVESTTVQSFRLNKYDHSGSAYKHIFTAFDILYKSI